MYLLCRRSSRIESVWTEWRVHVGQCAMVLTGATAGSRTAVVAMAAQAVGAAPLVELEDSGVVQLVAKPIMVRVVL